MDMDSLSQGKIALTNLTPMIEPTRSYLTEREFAIKSLTAHACWGQSVECEYYK